MIGAPPTSSHAVININPVFLKNLNPVYYRYISGINIHIHIYFRTFSLDHIFMFITHSQTNLTTHIKFLFFQCLPSSTSATGFITLSSCQACTPPTGGRSELVFYYQYHVCPIIGKTKIDHCRGYFALV